MRHDAQDVVLTTSRTSPQRICCGQLSPMRRPSERAYVVTASLTARMATSPYAPARPLWSAALNPVSATGTGAHGLAWPLAPMIGILQKRCPERHLEVLVSVSVSDVLFFF